MHVAALEVALKKPEDFGIAESLVYGAERGCIEIACARYECHPLAQRAAIMAQRPATPRLTHATQLAPHQGSRISCTLTQHPPLSPSTTDSANPEPSGSFEAALPPSQL